MMHWSLIKHEDYSSSFLYLSSVSLAGQKSWAAGFCSQELGGSTPETGTDGINLDAVTRQCGVTVNYICHTISLQTATSYY